MQIACSKAGFDGLILMMLFFSQFEAEHTKIEHLNLKLHGSIGIDFLRKWRLFNFFSASLNDFVKFLLI